MEAGCPTCTEEFGRKTSRQTRAVPLELLKRNYSGCGVDMAYCPKCGKGYCVSYKVDQVIHNPAWNVDVSEEA